MQTVLLKTLQLLCTLASGPGSKKKLFILIYHQVLEQPDFMRPWEIDKTVFSWQMALIARYFNVLPLHEALEKMANGTLPPRAVCITFDDGYANNYTHALPILLANKLTATFFIASGYLDGGRMWNDTVIESIRTLPGPRLDLTAIGLGSYDISNPVKKAQVAVDILPRIKHLQPAARAQYAGYLASLAKKMPDDLMLTSSQVMKLYVSGMEIGGHTVTHPILALLAPDEVRQEVADNKTTLEQLLNTKIRYFAYPNGKPGQDYSPDQVRIIKECGYQAALSTRPGVSAKGNDRWQLARFTPWDSSPARFMLRIARMYYFNRL
ncbi:Polysaccharide deacetylase [Candidatus Methylobacter favarea]|uniref:Polysaccharide deacetylase n=1 Tax=Candidatus Methylobacter favarea TaxID=2707345 RepID=A0A8S0X6K1_9GAMM|nr:polysaccharide deacetylase family protein [Candidatus Methylobacter favarea]CAA9889315.1 Polysaccharide deacetylase [Candidatus Methylobacter favarea]